MWFKVDDSLSQHPKALQAGADALGLWVLAGAWASAHLTDGFVPDYVLTRLEANGEALASQLVRVCLWHRVDGGYQFHDWDDYQPDAESAREVREKRREAGRKGGVASGNTRKEQSSRSVNTEAKREASAEAHAEAKTKQKRTPSPSPSPCINETPSESRSHEAPASALASVTPSNATSADATKVAQTLAARYCEREPLSKYPAIMTIARRALNAGRTPDAVDAALARLAEQGRSVTVDSLRIELDGPPRAASKPSTTDQRVRDAQRLKGGSS